MLSWLCFSLLDSYAIMCQPLFAVGLLMTCLRWTSAADVPEGTVYEEVDGTAVLHPGSALTGNIKTVLWKYDGVIAAELYRSAIICFQPFKGRCELNIITGELTINHLTLSDSGFYSAEINGKETNTVQLQVMTPVPKPLVLTWCDPPKTYCLLTCEGTSSVPESLQYRWNEENDWSHSMKVLNITKENKEPEFSCELKNPVSSSRSDPVQNPFIPANLLWIIAVVLVILLIVIVAVVLYYKLKNLSQKGAETAAPGTVYEEVNGTTVLHPGSAHTGYIKTVTWKHNDDTVADWYGRTTFFYQQFKDRFELNTRTGELMIKHLKLSDSGSYSVEINGKETNTVQLQVMSKKRTAPVGTVYEEVDGTAVLHPGSAVIGNMERVIWKYNSRTAVVWYGGDVSFFRQFQGRCELNTRTGELTIKHLTLSDSGFYSAEINNKEVNTVQLQVKRDSKTETAAETVYKEVDGITVLHPGSEHTGNITKIIWKYNGSEAASWTEKMPHYYGHFKGRCELNTRTGELTINNLTLSDSGSYSVEINNKEVSRVQLQVMSKKKAAAVYEDVDGTAVLHPGSAVIGNMERVIWKYNSRTAVVWYGGDVSFFRQFQGRFELNIRTGELTINHLTLSDSGFYSVEINGRKNNRVQLWVMGKKTAAEADAEQTTGEAGDEEEPGETTKLLSQSGGVQQESRDDINYPPDVSPAVASWSPV